MQLLNAIKTLEIKNGLYEVSDEELKNLHCILTKMMVDVATFCVENNIGWSLSGGSILGAVRHQGFIPWDDDIDIFMTRQDFEKFRMLFPKKYADKYQLKVPGDKDYLMHYPQIMKKNTTVKPIQSVGNQTEGLAIDIFILENTYNNKILRTLHGILCTLLLFIDSVTRVDLCKENLLKYGSESKSLDKAVKRRTVFSKLFKFFAFEKWLQISDRCFSCVTNNKSKYVVAPGGARHYFGEIFERDKVCKYIKVPFENEEFNIPLDYDYYLKLRYGNDYMKLPSEEQKERHIYIKFSLDH